MNRFFCRNEEVEIAPYDVRISYADGSFCCENCGGEVDVLLDDGENVNEWEVKVGKQLAFMAGHWRGRMNHAGGIANDMWHEAHCLLELLRYPAGKIEEEGSDE